MKNTRLAALLALAGSAFVAHAQVVIGLDDGTQTARTYNPSSGLYEDFTPNGGLGIRGLAADDASRTLYAINGAQLWRISYDAPRTPTLVASLTGAVTSISGGLAWVPGENILYATTTSSLYTINPSTGVTTLVRSFGSGDFGGLDYNAADGKLYMSNDSTSITNGLTGRGIYTLEAPYATGTLVEIADYPTNPSAQTDIDGLAVGGGNVYLSRDFDNMTLYVYNLSTNTYTGPITRPGGTTTSEVFCGATYAAGLGVVIPGANLGVTIAEPADCTVGTGQPLVYTATVNNVGPDPATGVTLTVTIPANATLSSSIPAGTLVGNTLTISLGSIAANANTAATITLSATAGPDVVFSASVDGNEPDNLPGNDSASQTTVLLPTTPSTAAIKGVISNLVTSPTSDVPGLPGVKFAGTLPGRPYRSPNGQRWIQYWDTNIADTTTDEVVIVYDGSDISVALQEATTVIPPISQGPDTFDAVLSINDSGQFVWSGESTSSSTVDDSIIVKWDGTQFVLVAREGDTAPAGTGGTIFGATNGSVSIANDGSVSFLHAISGLTTTTDTFLFKNDGNTIVAQEGVTIPTGQPNQFSYKGFDAGTVDLGYVTNSTHSSFMVSGTVNDATTQDRVVSVDNNVVVQENIVLPGTSFTSGADDVSPVNGIRMEPDGTWFVRGDNNDDQDWVIRNGTVIAATDNPITPGNTELYDDAPFAETFFMMMGNNRGDWIVGGTTNASNGLANAVLVLNGTTVIARENDPIDLDNNGVFDDDVYIRTFVDDRAFMTDTDAYIVVRMRESGAAFCNLSDVDLAQALIRIPLPAPACVADVDDGSGTGTPDGGVGIEDLLYYLSIYDLGVIEADVDDGSGTGTRDGGVGIEDLLYYLQRYDAGC